MLLCHQLSLCNHATEMFVDNFITVVHIVKDLLMKNKESNVDPNLGFGFGVNAFYHPIFIRLNNMKRKGWFDTEKTTDFFAFTKLIKVPVQIQLAETIGIVRHEKLFRFEVLFHGNEP